MIEKRMVFYWEGETMSWLRYMTLYSFCKFNPDWVVELHLSVEKPIPGKNWKGFEEQDFHVYKGDNYFDRIQDLNIQIIEHETVRNDLSPAHKSDLFQWRILTRENCFYADMDILFVQPIAQIYDEVKYSHTVISFTKDASDWGYFSIGFIGSDGNNKFFQDVYNQAVKMSTRSQNRYQGCGVEAVNQTLGHPDWGRMCKKYVKLIAYNLPMEVVYPFLWNEGKKRWVETHKLPEQCIGIHWYGGAPDSQIANNKLNPDTVYEPCIDSTMTINLRKVLEA